VIIKVEVSDPTNITKVEFYINNEKVGEVTESPFEFVLDTTSFLNGEYNIIVRAYEETGSMTGVSINIWIRNTYYNNWQKTYGRGVNDKAHSIQQTNDGGYIVTGVIYGDVYVIKLDEKGNKIWEKTFGGKGDDGAYSIQQTNDGGYIVAGETTSFGAGNNDVYIIKLDENGNKVWEKTFGGIENDEALSVQQTNDGGYIVAGRTISFGAGEYDVYIIKLDENGNKIWEKTFGGKGDDVAFSIQQTKDGGYIVAGYTNSFGEGGDDVYIIKLDENGNKVWEKNHNKDYSDGSYSIKQTIDGGYIVAVLTWSFREGVGNVYIKKLDANGNLTYSVKNLIYSSNMVEENVKSVLKTMQTALEMYATDNYGNYTDNLLKILPYLPCGLFPKHPLTNEPYEIGINLFDPVNGGSPVKNSSDPRYQYAIVYEYDASNHTYTFIGYDQTNTKVIFILSNR
jgi:hypothetical protein